MRKVNPTLVGAFVLGAIGLVENMTGGKAPFQTFLDEALTVDGRGRLHSSFWDYD